MDDADRQLLRDTTDAGGKLTEEAFVDLVERLKLERMSPEEWRRIHGEALLYGDTQDRPPGTVRKP